MSKQLILALDFDELPPTLNVWQRWSWQRRVQEKKRWGELIAAELAPLSPGLPVPDADSKFEVIFHVSSSQAIDQANALGAWNKLITDNFRRREQRKVGDRFVWVPTICPLIWDDDPDHCHEEFHWRKGSERSLRVELWRIVEQKQRSA